MFCTVRTVSGGGGCLLVGITYVRRLVLVIRHGRATKGRM